MPKDISMETSDEQEMLHITSLRSDRALRHANLKLAALRAENAAMKRNIRFLIQELTRLEQGARNDAMMKTVA